MTLIERAETAILNLKQEGKLPDDFEITSMNISARHKIKVWGKADEDDPLYYRWSPSVTDNLILQCYVATLSDSAIPVWNDDEGYMDYKEGLEEKCVADLAVDLNSK